MIIRITKCVDLQFNQQILEFYHSDVHMNVNTFPYEVYSPMVA